MSTDPTAPPPPHDAPARQQRSVSAWHGLTVRQASLTLVIVLLLGLLAGLIELYADWQSMRRDIRDQTALTLQLTQGPAAEALFQYNETLATQVVDSLLAYPQIHSVKLQDNFGNGFAAGERAEPDRAGPVVHSLFGDLTHHTLPLQHRPEGGQPSHVGQLAIVLAADEIANSFMQRGLMLIVLGIVKALIISGLVVLVFYFLITRPLLALHAAIVRIDPTAPGRWARPRLSGHDRDELGQLVNSLDDLMHAFQRGLEQRDQARDENLRLGAELDVSRKIQQILLPSRAELDAIEPLEIATYMEPASEVGGDYYDILRHTGGVRIGIGDVTGHGLESGIVMLMTQSAVRTLLTCREEDMVRVMETLNTTIYENVQRMGCGKNLTLALLDYHSPRSEEALAGEKGRLRICGQHESIIIARRDGALEVIDTDELGFPIGLIDQVGEFVNHVDLHLFSGDTVVLYTDGITEAADEQHALYGLERLSALIQRHRALPAEDIKDLIVADVKRHIGSQTLYDDLTLVVLKQR